MLMIKWYSCIHLFFILLTYKSNTVHSILCCSGNSTCTAQPIDCPLNICYKLVFGTGSEYRGCMKDLFAILDFPTVVGGNQIDNFGFNSGSSNDQCQKLNSPGPGMSLCKCTSNLCNSSSTYSYFSFLALTFIIFVVYLFPRVFLS